ncbi:MAG: FtsX-like permease family protein [Eggerthellaceae bacterium]|nr:FtsX-like permease family protein [Eggerthellaceae bacterium]
MKPTQITELFANIRKTFVSFFSILMFVALGVGIFLGITWAGPALQTAADKVYDEGSLHDFQVQFSYGLTDDDLKKLADVEGVSLVEPAYQSFQQFALGEAEHTAKVQTFGSRVNIPIIVEGELPQKADEIALTAYAAKNLGIGVGDIIAFQKDADDADGDAGNDDAADADGMKFLNGSTFKVTALVNSPEYLANSSATYGISNTPSGKVDIVAFALPAAFDGGAFQDGYPIVNVRCDDLRGIGTFGGDYKSKSSDVKARIVELGNELSDARYHELYDSAKADVDDAERKLADAKNEVAGKEKELADARSQVQSSESELSNAYSTLVGSRGDLDSKWAEFNAKNAELQAKQAEFDAGVAAATQELATMVAAAEAAAQQAEAYAKANPQNAEAAQSAAIARATADEMAKTSVDDLEYPEGSGQTIGQARQSLAAAQAEVAAGRAALEQGEAELQSGWAEYNEGQSKLEQARTDIADGEQKLADAKKEIADNEGKVADAKDKLDELKSYNWTVSARTENAGAAEVSTFTDVTNNLSFSMAALFVIVGLLVSYSAVSRIVHEQITQIGTKKALGLRGREITLSFLAYSAIAVVAGAVIGAIVGIIAVEGIIGHVLGGMFFMGDYPPYFGLPLFLIVTLLEIVLVLGATWFACHSILREHAVELLKGEKPPEAKTRFYEKWAVWERLPLLTQTIVNNCMNDKRRVFSTIVGVAGCTALIVTAITLNNDVLKSYDKQYEDVYGFSYITFVDTDVEQAADNVQKAIEDQGLQGAKALRKSLILTKPNGDRGSICMVVPESPEDFSQVYHVNVSDGAVFDPSADGAWVSKAYAEKLGAKVGDTITVDAGDGVVHKVPIMGFYDFWLTSYEMVMGRDFYEREFDADLQPNVVLCASGDMSADDVADALANVDGFSSIDDDKAFQHRNFGEFASVSSAVVAIYLALAALMAVVVLLNLNVMFIDEKKRELIVLMINGFSVKDAKRYIYNDTIVLTAIGIVLGVVLGCVMGAITVGSVEPSTASFVKSVDLMAVLVGVIGSAVLAFIMSVISLRRIPRFELTDINKF